MATTRPLRADAERNREAILGAAAEAALHGLGDLSLDDVARLAGVGVGTVYRRFPTKDALLDALYEGRMTAYVEHSEAARDLAATEPWEAFRQHVTFLVEQQAADLGFSEVLRNPTRGSEAFRDLHRRALRASMALVKTVKAAGVLRDDFTHADLLLIGHANHGVLAAHQGAKPAVESSRRLLAVLLDGYRGN